MDPWPQVQDLIECFPDEDEQLQKFCQWHPKRMLVNELVAMMQCPPPRVRVSAGVGDAWHGWRPKARESERVSAGVRSREMHDAWMETESSLSALVRHLVQ